MSYFVYIQHNGILWPQKWAEEQVNSETGKPYPCAFKIKLDDKHKDMSLSELEFVYPKSTNPKNGI